ncbi:MAG TPA: DUF6266 family protein [Prolixibacteraceae bacterium]|jgi:hypothetical protein
MAQLRNGIESGLSGRVGGVVYARSKGINIVRSVPVRSKNSWTPRQLLHRLRFKAVNDYCAKYKYTLIRQIWNLADEYGHGYNLFLKANMPAFGLDGQLADVEKLHFSAGKLPLPLHFKAHRSALDPSKVEVSWLNDENLSRVYYHDELMMVAWYPDHTTAPIITGVKRIQGETVIDLPAGFESITGIYLFFASHDRDGYSPDQYFGI